MNILEINLITFMYIFIMDFHIYVIIQFFKKPNEIICLIVTYEAVILRK